MKTLTLPLKKEYFEQIKAGSKVTEYRVKNDYWTSRIEGKQYEKIVLTLGYPKKDDNPRRLERPWMGYEIKTIIHPIFNSEPTECFCIKVN